MLSSDPDVRRLAALRAIEGGLLRLKWLGAATRFEIVMRRHHRALKYGYNPGQPRVPRGNPDGGQWTSEEGATGNGGDRHSPGVVLAGGGRVMGGSRGRFGANFPGATYGQEVRLDQEISRTENALRQVRQYDPNWQPTGEGLTAPGSTEGAIRNARARADQAEAYLTRLRSGIGGNFGPPLEGNEPSQTFDGEAWIHAYRVANNRPDLFGRPAWSYDNGTVAVTELNGRLYFGVNSGAPGYEASDRNEADKWRSELIDKYPDVMATDNIGTAPNNSLYHAEATILFRAAEGNGGTLSGQSLEVHVDRWMCDSCRAVLPLLGLELGNPVVTFVDSFGFRRTMWNGIWLRGSSK